MFCANHGFAFYLALCSTPSKAKRKESSDSGQESSAQYLPPIPAIPPRCASHGSYQDSLGIVTELLARQPRVDGPLQDAATSTTEHTQADHRCSAFKVYSRMHETQTGTHAKGEAQPSKSKSLDLVREVDRAGGNIARASLHLLGSSSPEFRDVRESTPVVKRRRTEGEEGCAEPAVSVPTDIKPEPSRFKTLQLLVRRPFGGISKKKTEWRDGRSTVLNSNRSWWQSRFAQHAPRHNGESALSSERPQDCHPAPRHSDDLLTRASSQVPSDVLAPKSKSVDLDRFHAQSRTVPIWPAGSRVRPALPPAFVTEPTAAHNDVVSARADSHGDAAISEQKHPWLRQLKLQAVASSAEPSLSAKVSAATTPKSASSRRTSSRKSVVMGRRSSPRPEARRSVKKQRPPSVLLGQSLPIPPRSHRSRASTISSQNSIISSPQGKVIVSRRCYGPRSPMRHDETCSITTVGTSILFGDSTDVPSLAFPLATSPAKISPRVKKGRLPLRTEAIQRRNAGLCDGRSPRFGDLESRLNDGDAQEWVDEVDEAPTVTSIELAAFTKRFEDSLSPKARPGFLEMSDVTDSLNQLIGSFDESAGSVSLYSSPRKPKKSAYGHAICGALTPSQRVKRGPLGATPRRVCCSIVSTVSTEANSSFEDSEELQKLIESMMSADVSGSTSDHSMSKGDLALLSPFGSPLDTRDQSTTTSEDPPSAAGSATKLPPPRFLLNDRPISPPEIFSEFQHSLDNDLPNFLSGTSVVSPPTERYGL